MKKLYVLLLLFCGLTGFADTPPIINNPTPLVVCDSNNDGIGEFDLTVKILEILGELEPNLYSVSFYETITDAEVDGNSILNPTVYLNINPTPQIIYIRVGEIASGDYSITSLELVLNPTPTTNQPPNLTIEQIPFVGTAVFDLTLNEALFVDGQAGVSVTYHTSLADAVANVNPIPTPTFYTGVNGETIWAVAQNFSGCIATRSFQLIITNPDIVNIPDANFKAKLLAANATNQIARNIDGFNITIDVNSDGQIQLSEALQVAYLDVSNSNIADLTGIVSFTNLQELMCHTNPLTSLDTSGLNNLTYLNCSVTNISNLQVNGSPNLNRLYCHSSNLSTLDVSQLTNLTDLQCNSNHFTSLNVSASVSLQLLVIQNNPLTSIDLSNQSNLIELAATGCNFSSLDLSGCTNLRFLTAHNNGLTSLNISGLSHLTALECANNNLSNIDFSSATDLTFVNLENNTLQQLDLSHNPLLENLNIFLNLNLTYVNLKNGGNSSEFNLGACSSLHYVCADEGEIAAINASNASFGITDIEVNSYCSFTPGGNYNTISGTVRFDADGNGCDANDSAQPLVRMNMGGSNANGATFSNLEGNYAFYTGAGSFDWFPDIENAIWFNVTPTTGTTTFSNNNGNIAQQDFCLSANGNHPDVEIVIAPRMPARPGFDAVYKVVYKNKGNRALSGNLTFSYDDAVLDFVSSTVSPNSQATGQLSFSYTNLLPFENRSFYITLNVNGPMETPPVNIGDVLNFTATISPGEGDENPSDNQFQYHQTVVSSFDPNDIICIEGNIVSPSEIGNYLHYVINFENTGTADAENIVVRDVIDPNLFDVNSLQLLNSSASVTSRLTGNVAEFIFQNINLHSGGHGNILLKIRTKNSLVQGDSVSKRANIYFDYNFPVETLPENTLFQALSTPNVPMDSSISVYPNPTKGTVTINCNSTISSVQLYDVQGRLLQTQLVDDNQTMIDISNQSSGVYFLKIISEKGMRVQKLVRE